MVDKVTLTTMTTLQNDGSATAVINANNAAITTAIDNTLSRDGTTPNSMGAALDMNSFRIINLSAPVSSNDAARIADVGNVTLYATSASSSATAASISAASASGSVVTIGSSVMTASASAVSASSAATSASTAATSASTGATSASTGATSASTAATSASTGASSASTAATAAAASATAAGTTAGGYVYAFSTTTNSTGMTSATGTLRFNAATASGATAIFLTATTNDTGNPDIHTYSATWGAGTTVTNAGYILVKKQSAPANFAIYTVNAAVTDNTTWENIPVTYVTGGGSFSAADALIVIFTRTGDKGADGAGTVTGGANHALAVFSSATAIGSSISMTAGQLVLGQSGVNPIAVTLGGDTTINSTGSMTIANNAVSYAKIQQVSASNMVLGNMAAGASNVQEVSGTNIVTIIGGNASRLQTTGTWKLFYSDGSSVLNTLSLGSSGQIPIAQTVSTAPTFNTVSGSGTLTASGALALSSNVLLNNASNALSNGFSATSFSIGSVTGTNQTTLPVAGNGNFQHCSLNGTSTTGTWTVSCPAAVSSIVLQVVNAGSGTVSAAIAFSGFTKSTGDTWANANGNKYLFYINKANDYANIHVQALQ